MKSLRLGGFTWSLEVRVEEFLTWLLSVIGLDRPGGSHLRLSLFSSKVIDGFLRFSI